MKTQIMKPQVILLVLAFIFSTAAASAQKGAIIVGGSLGWSSESRSNDWGGPSFKDKSSSTFNIAPSAIFMLGDKLGVGLSLGYATNSSTDYSWDNNNVFIDRADFVSGSTFTITPSLRYVFAKFDKIVLYGDLMLPFSFGSGDSWREDYNADGSIKTTGAKDDYGTSGFGIVIQPGIGYCLTDKVTVFANVFHMNLYSTNSYDNKSGHVSTTSTSGGLINMIDPHFMIGVNYAF